jgi:hypothetical protein
MKEIVRSVKLDQHRAAAHGDRQAISLIMSARRTTAQRRRAALTASFKSPPWKRRTSNNGESHQSGGSSNAPAGGRNGDGGGDDGDDGGGDDDDPVCPIDTELTLLRKSGGPLTKTISLAADGSVHSDGSACVMSQGTAKRVKLADLGQLADLISGMTASEALALGTLRSDLPDEVRVVTKKACINGVPNNVISRTADNLIYPKGQALALLDHDCKGMPATVAAKLEKVGGFWNALLSVLPALKTIARVTRASTSAGLVRSDTGEPVNGSNGKHDYALVKDGRDIERFLKTLHDRCWLAGFGWKTVGAAGQLLDRSIIDRSVFGAERLVFEGPPSLKPPLVQDAEQRRPIVLHGSALDSIATCPPLTIVEKSALSMLRAKETQRLAPESGKARAAFIETQSRKLVERDGLSIATAERIVAQQCDGLLLPNIKLPFDDDELAGTTVADVLADPDRFVGETLADPLEGVSYGRCKAKIMRRADGSMWINSFAHGRTIYELKFDGDTVRTALEKVDDSDAVKTLIALDLLAALDEEEWELLRNEIAERTGINKRTIDKQRKKAREQQSAKRRQEAQTRRLAERTDPRPRIDVPNHDAEWLPQMQVLNDSLQQPLSKLPPLRDIDRDTSLVRKRHIPNTHAFTSEDANPGKEENND